MQLLRVQIRAKSKDLISRERRLVPGGNVSPTMRSFLSKQIALFIDDGGTYLEQKKSKSVPGRRFSKRHGFSVGVACESLLIQQQLAGGRRAEPLKHI